MSHELLVDMLVSGYLYTDKNNEKQLCRADGFRVKWYAA